ncbi:MAG: hypothetical protein M5T52_01930 [Ignavibacteriaceae bacterium]|nr:hypothetical protein [Ignavibacteriaceae bacterium]
MKTDNANSKLYWQKVYALDPKNAQAVEALKVYNKNIFLIS